MANDPLANIHLLKSLSVQARQSLAQRCVWRHVPARAQLLDSEDDGRDLLFIIDGRVRVVNYAASGREIAYAEIGSGGHVGELAALDGRVRSASVIAQSPCHVAALSATALEELLLDHPVLALVMLRHLAAIIRANDERIAELASVSAVQRVYRELLRLAKDTPDGGCIIEPLPTQQDIAGQIGTTRETVARALGALLKSGGAVKARRKLLIAQRSFLQNLAMDDDAD